MSESNRVKVPVSDEVYQKLEERGREQGLTPNKVAENLLIGVLRKVVGDKIRKTLDMPVDLLGNIGSLASKSDLDVDGWILKTLKDVVEDRYRFNLLEDDLELSDRDLRVLLMWYSAMKDRLAFSDIGEFLVYGMRQFMDPYMKLITKEHLKILES